MRLSAFITENLEQIVDEWEAFARTLLPAAATMTPLQLRDHSKEILQAIAADIEAPQSEQQRMARLQSRCGEDGAETPAATHGALRHNDGFDLQQLSAEFRALRASVLRLWLHDTPCDEAFAFDDMLRFNEAVDQALAESVARYAEEMDRSRNMFLAILGHDLRTPLGAITMTTQFLRLPQVPPQKMQEAAARIERSALAMGGMIKDLLEFTRSRLGNGIPVTLQDTDARHICETALDEVRTVYPQHEFRLDAAGAFKVQADADRLGQLLWNLLSNAAQHGAREFPILLSLRGDESHILIQVQNRGKPIPADALQVIFNPLVRRSDDDRDGLPAANLGLGLFIAHEIARAHRGEIRAESSEPQGTVFSVRLPRRGGAQSPAGA